MLGATVQEAGKDIEKCWFVEQKTVVPLVGCHLDEARIRGGGIERTNKFTTFGRGKQPVAAERR